MSLAIVDSSAAKLPIAYNCFFLIASKPTTRATTPTRRTPATATMAKRKSPPSAVGAVAGGAVLPVVAGGFLGGVAAEGWVATVWVPACRE